MDMITISKGNVELDVPSDQKDRYIKLGYSVIDKATGKVIEEAPLQDIGALQTRVAELTKENAELKEQIAKLTAKKSTTAKKAE